MGSLKKHDGGGRDLLERENLQFSLKNYEFQEPLSNVTLSVYFTISFLLSMVRGVLLYRRKY